jgi:GNAT superfamily N-acetyltransferase
MSDILYRPAVPSDALCLGVLATQVFLDTYATKGIRTAIAREVLQTCSVDACARALADGATSVLVAEHESHLVGFAQIAHGAMHALVGDEPAAELQRLYVQEPFTTRGVGRDLLRHAEKAAAARGADVLWLTTWIGNPRALSFYPRRGYEDVGETPHVFEGEEFPNRLFVKHVRHVEAG